MIQNIMKYFQFTVSCALLALMSCSTQIARVGTDTDIDLSGEWNDVDSRMVAESITEELLSQPWYARYSASLSNVPTVIVGVVRNNSSEHINTGTFIKDIERAMVNSARLDVVASSDQQEVLREERANQDLYVSEETRKQIGNELGADIMLLGSINTINDIEGRRQVRFYQIDIELLDIETNRKLWIGQKEIKKYIRKASARI